MKGFLALLCAVILIFGAMGVANAMVLLEDNFDSENGGSYQLNYNSFDHWTVTDGTVDLIGVGSPWNWFPGHGLYVDMDGSTGDAGKMISSDTIVLQTNHQYRLTFDLAGNQRDGESEYVNVQVNVGGLLSKTYSLDRSDPFQTFSEVMNSGTDTSATIAFEGVGGDNIGMLLDNVKFESVPEPGALLLLGSGLVGLAGFRLSRKKKK